jgi:hypothetical protein
MGARSGRKGLVAKALNSSRTARRRRLRKKPRQEIMRNIYAVDLETLVRAIMLRHQAHVVKHGAMEDVSKLITAIVISSR